MSCGGWLWWVDKLSVAVLYERWIRVCKKYLCVYIFFIEERKSKVISCDIRVVGRNCLAHERLWPTWCRRHLPLTWMDESSPLGLCLFGSSPLIIQFFPSIQVPFSFNVLDEPRSNQIQRRRNDNKFYWFYLTDRVNLVLRCAWTWIGKLLPMRDFLVWLTICFISTVHLSEIGFLATV